MIPAKVPVPELERRQAHIDLIPPDHPLLPTTLHCLKDNESERPTATQFCQILTAQKRTTRYNESSQQNLYQRLREKDEQLLAKEGEVNQLTTRLDQAKQDNNTLRHEVGDREKQLKTLHHELQSTEENCAALQQALQQRDREVSELRQELASKNEQVLTTRMHHVALQDERHTPSMRPVTVGRWESLPDIPIDMFAGSSAVIGDKTYIKSAGDNIVYEFNNNQWNELPSNRPNSYCKTCIVSVDNILTIVGEWSLSSTSNKLCSYINNLYSYINNRWVEYFPPMPTKHTNPAAVYANKTLIVAGGNIVGQLLTTVEILNTANRQWSSVSSLPVGMNCPSTTICEDFVYIHPQTSNQEKNSVYQCSLEQLVQSQPRSAIWDKIPSLPVSFSSLITVNGHLLAVGGQEANDDSNNIYQYINKSWTVVGHMTSPRSKPFTTILPGNKLMVIGRHGENRKCDVATIT